MLRTTEDAATIARNVASIQEVPAHLLTVDEKEFHTQEARQGMDVYAYSNAFVWNLWHLNERIELGATTAICARCLHDAVALMPCSCSCHKTWRKGVR